MFDFPKWTVCYLKTIFTFPLSRTKLNEKKGERLGESRKLNEDTVFGESFECLIKIHDLVDDWLVHCCTLSLCYLGAETIFHLVGQLTTGDQALTLNSYHTLETFPECIESKT